MSAQPWTLWGIDLSYFTGKLEAILRARGVAYDRQLITGANWPQLAKKVGVHHMPYIELPDGDFLSDTTLILRWLEDHTDGPTLSPAPGHARFISRLFEDWGDEYLWRPAMYYRWWIPESRHMSSRRIADQVATSLPGFIPMWLKRRIIITRQYYFYVKWDGVRTAAHREATEQLYRTLLDQLDAIFAKRDFLLGDRPTDADFGLFGPFFRHFFHDPVPGAIMQDHAPHVLLWAARLWALTPDDFQDRPVIDRIPDDLGPLLDHLSGTYIPYLRANADCVAAGDKHTRYTAHGVDWKEQAKPFRLWCLSDMQDQFAALDTGEQAKVRALLGDAAVDQLIAPLPADPIAPPSLPITPKSEKAVDSWFR